MTHNVQEVGQIGQSLLRLEAYIDDGDHEREARYDRRCYTVVGHAHTFLNVFSA